MGGNGIVSRSVASSLRLRSGMGLHVGKHILPDKPLPVNDELIWDNGTAFPEPCIDRIADTIGKYEALAWMCGGLSFFASLGFLALWNDKASRIPFFCAEFWRNTDYDIHEDRPDIHAHVSHLMEIEMDTNSLPKFIILGHIRTYVKTVGSWAASTKFKVFGRNGWCKAMPMVQSKAGVQFGDRAFPVVLYIFKGAKFN
ncbi:hypothetical protein DITRI_Ditri07aG0151700 [Diplodiscus trichospermus]